MIMKNFILLLCLSLMSCGGAQEMKTETPKQLRSDLYYGYYITSPTQVEETRGHFNLLWVGGPFGDEAAIANMKSAKISTVFDVSDHLYARINGKSVFNEDAEGSLRSILTRLKKEGIIQYVVALYPIDEPDLNVRSELDVILANKAARKVMAEFPELRSAKLAVIYSNSGNHFDVANYDWVGFDDYSLGASIVYMSKYDSLKKKLRQDQRTILVPGGAYGQDPTPFFNLAENDQKVIALVPFLWTDTTDFPGIRSNQVKKAYCETGKKVIKAIPTTC